MCLEVGFGYREKVTHYMGSKGCFIISKMKIQALQCEILALCSWLVFHPSLTGIDFHSKSA